MNVTANGQAYAVAFRVADRTGVTKKVFESQDTALSRDLLSRWLAAMDVDLSRPEVAGEIDGLLALATYRDFNDPLPPTHGVKLISVTGGPATGPVREGQPWLVVFWIVLWLTGVLIIRRRHRRSILPLAGKACSLWERFVAQAGIADALSCASHLQACLPKLAISGSAALWKLRRLIVTAVVWLPAWKVTCSSRMSERSIKVGRP